MEDAKIPFVKPCHVGNFKIWRSKYEVTVSPTDEQRKEVRVKSDGKKKATNRKVSIECINISNLDGSFAVRIPQMFEMFGMLTVAYQWYFGDDADRKARGEEYLRSVLSNLMYVSCISNGYYHTGIQALTSVYADPDKLNDREFIKNVGEAIDKFVAWHKDYTAGTDGGSESEDRQDEMAEEAMSLLEGQDKK